jgi:DNA polymerase delta subunit 2
MVEPQEETGSLLRSPTFVSALFLHQRRSNKNPRTPPPSLIRAPSSYKPLHTFTLASTKHYQQQYSDIYFLRLAKLKPAVESIATEAWNGFQIAGEVVEKVDRVLDVRQGKLCWVAGTIYMEMPLKPNILEDISKDVSAPLC